MKIEGDIPLINLGEVIESNPETQSVTIQWIGRSEKAENVRVLNPAGGYSFPRIGDRGLIVTTGSQNYFLGKIEFDYPGKTQGAFKDKITGTKLLAKVVEGGEVFLSNLMRRTMLSLPNTGDFSLMNGLNEGIRYFFQNRLLRLAGMSLEVLGQGVAGNIGTVVRSIPSIGKIPISTVSNAALSVFGLIATIPAVEVLFKVSYNSLKLARLHLGHVIDDLGIQTDFSSAGQPLLALLETSIDGVTQASALMMDKIGNSELLSKIANVILTPGAAGLVQLGGIAAAEPVVKGTAYTTVENTFLTAIQTFCAAVQAAVAVVGTDVQNAAALTAIGTAASNLSTAASTFSSALAGTLSVKTMTM